MKKWYKMAGALLVGVCAITRVNAQTHYGQGAGTQGSAHSFFGLDAGKSIPALTIRLSDTTQGRQIRRVVVIRLSVIMLAILRTLLGPRIHS